jgi:hypothetical protein
MEEGLKILNQNIKTGISPQPCIGSSPNLNLSLGTKAK